MAETVAHILPDGRKVQEITLSGYGLTAKVLTLGAAVRDLRLEGHIPPLVLGHANVSDYVTNPGFLGAVVGRYANRLKDGRVTIDGKLYQLDRNDGNHTLHGGAEGSFAQIWSIEEMAEDHLHLSLTLEDGHMGFPGRLHITAAYRLLPEATLEVRLEASADKATLCNLASHMYFNLDGTKDISAHALDIACDHVIPVDATGIPTGDIQSVTGSEFDFRRARPAQDMPLDHNFCTRDPGRLHRNARLRAGNGRELVVYSDQPGLQVFNAAQMDTGVPGLLGHTNGKFCGVAFEPQIWPDAPNQTGFPNALLRPGETYSSRSLFVFE